MIRKILNVVLTILIGITIVALCVNGAKTTPTKWMVTFTDGTTRTLDKGNTRVEALQKAGWQLNPVLDFSKNTPFGHPPCGYFMPENIKSVEKIALTSQQESIAMECDEKTSKLLVVMVILIVIAACLKAYWLNVESKQCKRI